MMKILTPLLATAGVALLLAGCGSSKTNDPAPARGNLSFHSFASAAYKHAACMRSHGLPGFPDPQIVNAPGQHGIRQQLPQVVAASPQFKAAEEACKALLPAPQNQGPAQQANEQRARAHYLLAFAQCLRAHGVTGFPDPTPQGRLTLEMIHVANVDLQAPSFLSAAGACVGVTHGAITLAEVEEAIHHPSAPGTATTQSSGGSEASGGGQ